MRYIDGDALIKKLGIAYDCRECDKDKSPYCTWKPDVVDVCEAICDAPTIETEQKKGQWVEHNTEHSTYFDCSRCGCCAPCTETADAFMWKLSNYCPDCGAKMCEGENYEGNRWRRFEKKSTRGCSRIMEDENQGEC